MLAALFSGFHVYRVTVSFSRGYRKDGWCQLIHSQMLDTLYDPEIQTLPSSLSYWKAPFTLFLKLKTENSKQVYQIYKAWKWKVNSWLTVTIIVDRHLRFLGDIQKYYEKYVTPAKLVAGSFMVHFFNRVLGNCHMFSLVRIDLSIFWWQKTIPLWPFFPPIFKQALSTSEAFFSKKDWYNRNSSCTLSSRVKPF